MSVKLPSSAEWFACEPRAELGFLIDHLLAPEPDAAFLAIRRSRPPVRRKPATPLYDQFLADLEEKNRGEDASCVLEHIEQFEQPITLSLKMEELLRVVLAERKKIVAAP